MAWLCCVALLLVVAERPAYAWWLENHVLGDEARIEVDRSGKAVVEHRMTVKTNGSVRLKDYELKGVDRDAVPLPNSYVVPIRSGIAGSLDAAVPLSMELHYPKRRKGELEDPPAVLKIKVGDRKGLRRGTYLFVLRYRTDLRARGLISRDGAMVRVQWDGPIFDDGFDSARIVFQLPASPTPPRAAQEVVAEDDRSLAGSFLSEVRRGTDRDEIELLRSYAAKGERISWAVRVDQRALDPLPVVESDAAEADEPSPVTFAAKGRPPKWLAAGGAGLFLFYLLLVWLKSREVKRKARAAKAIVPPMIGLPTPLRALGAAAALVGGVGLQLLWDEPTWGACAVVLACLLAAHGAARLEPSSAMRGPGRWLAVTEGEALCELPRPRGAWLDVSTRAGKLLLLLLLAGVGVATWWVSTRSLPEALLVGFDSVALLAVFGTGKLTSLPPDMAVEPARFLRKLVRKLRKKKGMANLRLVPKIRIPKGQVDPDELRLMVVPPVPLRGFTAIEVGVTYALGVGARVAMPEVLLRVVEGSPCDEAVAAISSSGRITPGRKPDERVIALSPRVPTVRSTVEITAALATRVVDREASRQRPERKSPTVTTKQERRKPAEPSEPKAA
ncbi:MAG: hypothetical protein JRI68_23160 [Deltaproteobacteria bacterium]|nr:hypothetical protein [Deltaproteobacteria bacterium]